MSANTLNDTACSGSGLRPGVDNRCTVCSRDVVMKGDGLTPRHQPRCALNTDEGDRCELWAHHRGRCKGRRYYRRQAERLEGCTR